MAKRHNKAAKIRAVLADNPDASAKEVVQTLAARRVRVAAVLDGLPAPSYPKNEGE